MLENGQTYVKNFKNMFGRFSTLCMKGLNNHVLISYSVVNFVGNKPFYPFQPSVAFHIETSHLTGEPDKWLVSIWNATLGWNELNKGEHRYEMGSNITQYFRFRGQSPLF